MKKTAVVTGVTGQDGSYLVELLLQKDYRVCCIVRRTTYSLSLSNLEYAYHTQLEIYDADLLDQMSIMKVFETCVNADCIEIYNLAAQSDVSVSFKCPRLTIETNMIGTLNLLESIRQLDIMDKCKFYQASTSEMFGKVSESPQNEQTDFHPRSPYGISKLGSHWLVKNYHETYGLFACCGILFNHESPRRGDKFVTQKIIKGVKSIMDGKEDCIEIGNLDAKRDWGHAKDYVEAMWLMLQQDKCDDYVVATGKSTSIRSLIEIIFKFYEIEIVWEGKGLKEIGKDKQTNKTLIRVNEKFYRPCEVDALIGDSTKMRTLGWNPTYDLESLVKDMIESTNHEERDKE